MKYYGCEFIYTKLMNAYEMRLSYATCYVRPDEFIGKETKFKTEEAGVSLCINESSGFFGLRTSTTCFPVMEYNLVCPYYNYDLYTSQEDVVTCLLIDDSGVSHRVDPVPESCTGYSGQLCPETYSEETSYYNNDPK